MSTTQMARAAAVIIAVLLLKTSYDGVRRTFDLRDAAAAEARADSLFAAQLRRGHVMAERLRAGEEEMARLGEHLAVWVNRANAASERRGRVVEAAVAPQRNAHDSTIAREAAELTRDSLVANEIEPLRVSLGIVQRQYAISEQGRREVVGAWQDARLALEASRVEAAEWKAAAGKPRISWRSALVGGVLLGAAATLALQR